MMKTTTKTKGSSHPKGALRHIMIEPAEGGYSVTTHREPVRKKGGGEEAMPMYDHNPKPHVFTHHAPMLKHVKSELGVGASTGEANTAEELDETE